MYVLLCWTDTLLSLTARLLHSVLYADDAVCEAWAGAEIVLATLESLKQLG